MTDSVSSSAQVSWIMGLPNEGGDWGRGIVGTVNEVEGKIARARAEVAQLDAKRAELTSTIAVSEKLLKSTVKRAESEAPMMFAGAQIAKAKGKVQVAAEAPHT